ncbi:MAG TPA: DoxX family protein [Xanthobacteraceae bacterium]|nr:DoxX family protein [Xanthobacteraceae bacterium]
MEQTDREPKLLLPGLRPFYDAVIPFTWPLVRVGVGWILIVHGWGKIMRGMPRQAEMLVHDGINLGIPFAVFLTIVELGGGICIAIGLFTRFWAAAVAIEMGYLTFIHYWHNGFSWLNRGYEFVLLWGIVSLAIALRGGGPYSLDRKLGREL